MYPIAFVTTCKGRLHHIKQTLATIVAEAPAEIILVDYACPDNTGDWVEKNFPSVKVVRVKDDAGFCLPRARNIGAANSSAPWLCFIDADIKVQSGWIEWMRNNLDNSCFYRASRIDGKQLQEIAGTFICPRNAFNSIAGYDEVFRGWGGEDIDLYARLADVAKVQTAYYPQQFVKPIAHADDERTTFHAIKNIKIQSLINGCYVKAKAHLHSNGIREIPFETRQRMLDTLSNHLRQYQSQPNTFAIRLQADNLLDCDGKPVDVLLEVTKRRRYKLFGARQTSVRTLSQGSAR
ncbi:MAG TPA: galactosyltransferase-related protein [Pseudomonas sp.]|nr:galactosyltransferase-related protein [Pseudomonas sp.]